MPHQPRVHAYRRVALAQKHNRPQQSDGAPALDVRVDEVRNHLLPLADASRNLQLPVNSRFVRVRVLGCAKRLRLHVTASVITLPRVPRVLLPVGHADTALHIGKPILGFSEHKPGELSRPPRIVHDAGLHEHLLPQLRLGEGGEPVSARIGNTSSSGGADAAGGGSAGV
ncbi:unnamed protein product, partial [Closterium sp. NIES-53]